MLPGHSAPDLKPVRQLIEHDGLEPFVVGDIRTYAATGADKERYEQKAAEYDSRFKKAEARLAKLKAERDERSARSRMIEGFIDEMLNAPLVLTEWQDQLWNMLVQKAVISADGTVAFTFKGEKTITVRTE